MTTRTRWAGWAMIAALALPGAAYPTAITIRTEIYPAAAVIGGDLLRLRAGRKSHLHKNGRV